MKNLNTLFIVAQGSLLMAFILHRYFAKNLAVLVFIGFFACISIVFNIVFLVKKGRQMMSKSKTQDS
jgi:hypothetical protein